MKRGTEKHQAKGIGFSWLPMLVVSGLAVGFTLLGCLVMVADVFPGTLVKRIHNKLSAPPYGFQVPVVESHFFPLALEYQNVDRERPGSGGGFTTVRDQHLLLLTHDGRVFWIREGMAPEPLAIQAPENGLADYQALALDPAYASYTFVYEHYRYNDIESFLFDGSHYLAISYLKFQPGENCYTTSIAVTPWPDQGADPSSVRIRSADWQNWFSSEPCLPLKVENNAIDGHQGGGAIGFRAPRTLILANGDFHWDGMFGPSVVSQSEGTQYGSVIALDLHTKQASVMSIGHRNPQGLVVADDQVWIVEHGARGGDELNQIQVGSNYGWPLESYGTDYDRSKLKDAVSFGRHENFSKPVFAWVPSVATSGITRIRQFHPSWDGDFLVSSLNARKLFRLRMDQGRVVFSEPLAISNFRIRDVHQHTQGLLALWTDRYNVILMRPDAADFGDGTELADRIESLQLGPSRATRLSLTMKSCLSCHTLKATKPSKLGLTGIVGRRIGGEEFSNYSKSLRDRSSVWTPELLAEFLHSPGDFAPGTLMPQPKLSSQEIEDLVALLDSL